MQRKKDRGECWLCEDKWVRGHKCAYKQLLMLDILDEDDLVDKTPLELQAELQTMELSECILWHL